MEDTWSRHAFWGERRSSRCASTAAAGTVASQVRLHRLTPREIRNAEFGRSKKRSPSTTYRAPSDAVITAQIHPMQHLCCAPALSPVGVRRVDPPTFLDFRHSTSKQTNGSVGKLNSVGTRGTTDIPARTGASDGIGSADHRSPDRARGAARWRCRPRACPPGVDRPA